MLDWQTDVVDRNLSGSDEEITALLLADKRTVDQMPALAFRRKLREWGLLKQSAETKLWIGPLMDLYKSEYATAELKNGIDDLVSTFEEGTDSIATEREPYASQFWGLAAVLLSLQMVGPEQVEEVYNLAGGMKYGGITEEVVTDVRQQYENIQRANAGQEKYNELERELHIKFNEARNAAANAISEGPEAVQTAWDEVFK